MKYLGLLAMLAFISGCGPDVQSKIEHAASEHYGKPATVTGYRVVFNTRIDSVQMRHLVAKAERCSNIGSAYLKEYSAKMNTATIYALTDHKQYAQTVADSASAIKDTADAYKDSVAMCLATGRLLAAHRKDDRVFYEVYANGDTLYFNNTYNFIDVRKIDLPSSL